MFENLVWALLLSIYLSKHSPCYSNQSQATHSHYSGEKERETPHSLPDHSYFKSASLPISYSDFFFESLSPMRPYLAVSLLLLSLLLSEVQGIRLDKSFMSSVGQHKVHEEKSALTKIHDSAVQEVILCKDGHCSGKNRKLITTTTTSTTSTTTTSKNEKNGENKADTNSKGKSGSGELGEQENFMVKGMPTSEVFQSHDHHEQFPDIIDLAEMDYSPAKRKPPIHN